MKLKPALLATLGLLAVAAAAFAGPSSISISIGGGNGCRPRAYCAPQPGCPGFFPATCAPVAYFNPAPVVWYGTAPRFSNVSGFVTGGQGVIQVSQPVFVTQPVVVYPHRFRWR